MEHDTPEATADFGFRTVKREEKAQLVRGVFEAVASRYDVMNDAMSLGLHRVWKAQFVSRLNPKSGEQLLDLAGGTGDIAFACLKRAPGLHVTLCDINQAMLSEGKDRAIDHNVIEPLEWVCGNAEILPFAPSHFDAVTIAFGIRNVTDIPAALKEIHRVLKPGGRFFCLEFSQLPNHALQKLYDAYSMHLIPRMGKWIAGDAAPYQYLVESIRKFPDAGRFADMISEAGFAQTRFAHLNAGVVAIHSGWRV